MSSTVLARNNVRVFGSGDEVLLFAHGFGCDQNMWRYITPAFERDYRIVLFDHVGSGRSDLKAYTPDRYGDLTGYVHDVAEICEALDLRRVILVAHSVSCMVGLLASLERPSLFECLILIGPSPCYINQPPDYIGGFEREDVEDLLSMMETNYLGWASFFAPTVMQNADQPELASELEGSFCSTNPRTALGFARATFLADNRADLAKMSIPALIVQCTDDLIAPMSVGSYVHRHLAGSTLRIIEATGHCPHLSHSAETIRLMQEYLAGRETKGS